MLLIVDDANLIIDKENDNVENDAIFNRDDITNIYMDVSYISTSSPKLMFHLFLLISKTIRKETS